MGIKKEKFWEVWEGIIGKSLSILGASLLLETIYLHQKFINFAKNFPCQKFVWYGI